MLLYWPLVGKLNFFLFHPEKKRILLDSVAWLSTCVLSVWRLIQSPQPEYTVTLSESDSRFLSWCDFWHQPDSRSRPLSQVSLPASGPARLPSDSVRFVEVICFIYFLCMGTWTVWLISIWLSPDFVFTYAASMLLKSETRNKTAEYVFSLVYNSITSI